MFGMNDQIACLKNADFAQKFITFSAFWLSVNADQKYPAQKTLPDDRFETLFQAAIAHKNRQMQHKRW